ncbi:MAG: ABC transporter permease [Bdellovibrionaceae bacterium]|nr:ABC transporter permease [Pseudobdellovibrionaceae bacterium]
MSKDKNKNSNEDIEVSKTLFQLMREQFMEHTAAKYSLLIIVFLMVAALCAPLISKVTGISPDAQNIFNRYASPMTTNTLSEDEEESRVEEFIDSYPEEVRKIIAQIKSDDLAMSTLEDSTDDDLIFDFMATLKDPVSKQSWITKDNFSINYLLDIKESLTTFHLLGTDELGRDVAMRLLFGARISIGVGLLVSFASAIIGLLIGACAGYFGGILDSMLMRITDSLLSLPQLPLMIVFAAVDLGKIPYLNHFVGSENESVIKLITILCLFSWMTVARLVRSSVLVLKEQEFILAAKNLGASSYKIIMTHMVPNALGTLLVAVTINVGSAILSEAALSFLGLGIQPPIPSWGNMLLNAKEVIYESPALTFFPGLLIFIVVISFNFIGDGLQNSVNPKSIKR